MRMNEEGKIDISSRATFRVLEEFGWNIEEMAHAILDLRIDIEDKEKVIFELEKPDK